MGSIITNEGANPGPECEANSARDAAVEYLLGRINYERSLSPPYAERYLKLDRMRNLLLRLGNPDAGLPIVHIAGTKGKGSTSSMLASILQSAGLDVGVFSSPHLERLEERFAVNGVACSAGELAALVSRIQPVIGQMDADAKARGDDGLRPTFFEIVTAVALMHFSQRQVDAAVLEVGLGGRLDSTNVCQPIISVITSISYDHTKQLGTTLGQIAAEKAGIIKPGVPVVVGRLPDEARRVVAEIARQRGARMIEAGRDFAHRYRAPKCVDQTGAIGSIDFEAVGPPAFRLDHLPLRMLGPHHADNAALALAGAVELKRRKWLISRVAMRRGLADAALPGRVELLQRRPAVVLDVAHNVASAQALAECLRGCFSAQRRVLVFAGTRDKDLKGMARVLAPYFHKVVLTRYTDNDRAASLESLTKLWNEAILREAGETGARTTTLIVREDPLDAWRTARELAGVDELICVTGSFFIAAQLRQAMVRQCARSEQTV